MSKLKLQDRSVFVTGGSCGIGLAITRELARRGANVFIVSLDKDDPLAVRDQLQKEFPKVRFGAAVCDVADYAAVERAVDQMIEQFGSVGGVVCNAGVDRPSRFAEKSPDEFRQLMEVNYLGSVHAAKAGLPHLQPGSFISFTSSMAGVLGIYGYSSYAPTKFAQIGLAETLSQELKPEGIQVSVLCPPDTDTPGLRDPSKSVPEETQAIVGQAKLMKAEDVAKKFIDQLVAGKFHIKVNFPSHMIYRFKGAGTERVLLGAAPHDTQIQGRIMLFRDKRLLILTAMLLCIAGFASFRTLPNSEDPTLSQRFGSVTTRLPGADAERVDALITSKIEDALLSVEEVHTLKSMSRAGFSLIDVELEEWVRPDQIDQAWTRVRAKVDEMRPSLPADATIPIIDDDLANAMSFIAAVVWHGESDPLLSVLQRYAKELEDVLLLVPDTEKTVMFGEVKEEIQVTLDPQTLGSLGLTTSQIADAIANRDSREPAGRLHSDTVELGIEVEGAIESLDRLSELSVVIGAGSQAVKLQDIALIEKGVTDPPEELVIIDGNRGIAVSSRMKAGARTEIWTGMVLDRLDEFKLRLPPAIQLEIPFQQSVYTIKRLKSLRMSLALAVISVVVVNIVLMGWRSSLIVSLSIPATILFALIFMNVMGVAIHQMSVVGFIVALGMLIDNAIIMVDEIRQRAAETSSITDAVQGSIRRLAIPLLASTLTSVLAFMPIALMPGGTGEFMRAMAMTVIACLIASYVLAITMVPALMGHLQSLVRQENSTGFLYQGISSERLTGVYAHLLSLTCQNPGKVIVIVTVLSGVGIFLGLQQEQELFPMSDRDQFNIRLELPMTASIDATAAAVTAASEQILADPDVIGIDWFVGTGAPVFYYNLTSFTAAAANSAEAMVQVKDPEQIVATIRNIQRMLDRKFPQCQSIVRQLGQGEMPLAPIELSIKGPDIFELSEFSEQLRSRLIATPGVIHTRSTIKDGQTKLMLQIDEPHVYQAELTNDHVARQLSQAIEGAVGGSLLEDTEELPIRVRFAKNTRASVQSLRSIELISAATAQQQSDNRNRSLPTWLPLDAIGTLKLVPELSEIHRLDGERSATVQGFLSAGTLPSKVFSDFQDELDQFTKELPGGYSVKIAGDAEVQGDALVSLMAYMGVVMTLMLAVLVISLKTFRGTAIIISVAILSVGFGLGALWFGQYNFGFSAILGVVGLIGVSINDSIVVLTGILNDKDASSGDYDAIGRVVMRDTRHVIATSVTTMAGFVPLIYGTSSIWPPLAVVIGFGVAGATLIALFFTPAAYLMFARKLGQQLGT